MTTSPLAILPVTIAPAAAGAWHFATLGGSLLALAVFALAGLLLVVVSCKLLEYCTRNESPGVIVEHNDVAAAPPAP